MNLLDYIGLGLFLFQYGGYHVFYMHISKKKHYITRDSLIAEFRKKWLRTIKDEKNPIFAIQTIRNLTMTSTFLISVPMIISGALFSVFSDKIDWFDLIEQRRYLDFLILHPVAIKLLVALGVLLTSATNFLFSLRILYNMNFTMSSSYKPESEEFQVEQLERHNKHFLVGVRSLYYFISPMLWIIDPIVMIFYTILTTYLFLRFDFIKARRIE